MQNEFRPHDPIDLEDQNLALLVLEELAISHMQRYWIDRFAPENEDAPLMRSQDDEVRADLLSILQGKEKNEDRIIDTGWAGARLAAHLRVVLKDVFAAFGFDFNKASDDEVVEAALSAYLEQTERLVEEDVQAKNSGAKGLDPKRYMAFMIEWSSVFSGKGEVGPTEVGFVKQ